MAVRQITNTVEAESNPSFNGKESKIIYSKASNLYSFNLSTGETEQLSNFLTGTKKTETKANEQEKWLKKDQLSLFEVLKERADKKKQGEAIAKEDLPKRAKEIYIEDKRVDIQTLSPDENYITYRLTKSATGAKNAVADFV
eukprot:gene4711-5900_t